MLGHHLGGRSLGHGTGSDHSQRVALRHLDKRLPRNTGSLKPDYQLVVRCDTNPHTHTHANSNSNSNSDTVSHTNTDSNTNSNTNSNSHAHPNPHANSNRNTNPNPNRNTHVDRFTNPHVDLNLEPHADVVPRHTLDAGGADVQTDADAHPAPDASPIYHRPGPE